ncbi:DUF2264 domain-containing protein [Agrobacterium tumefaciens]|uniref:DUF2264 domain-containing protein n=1 Tax=Agrobacterium tumefaciens TaxID=358 RepID=A0AA44J947_AGRTU|nr:DUF2264 domain-containing protein [Agrobacterium tumefaciens]NTB87523.1 DUF2264 domain-containing protein [Agrobacterium tumefaciens]NTC17508.1 DUF2264 domain-containing protein [Agrobacterium tumefaciens]NTC29710.1 DUF2264 domain-containing protein [Agrobacterium tumefaciens]
MIYDPSRANPLHGNPLLTRADLAKAVIDLFTPLLPYFSDGGARVRLSATGAHFDRAAADLEGFARPLWGIVPLAAGGTDFPHWDLYRRGLANGADPSHQEYWGDISDRDQRQVELAAIGFTLAMVPQHIWDPLTEAQKDTVSQYLLSARDKDFVDNNWKFFRVLIDLGLERVGVPFDRLKTETYLNEVEAFRLGEGWYRDGPVRRVDHYVPFAMHFYALIYSRLAGNDAQRGDAYRERARVFASDIRHWFGPDGAALAFGRSQTYRFAAGGFWGALAFAGVEALPWAQMKGYYLRHIRWWSHMPIADRDGVLSIGYGYPNLLMSESYNSAGSPYWAMKFFLALALPEDHPFWQAQEAPAPNFQSPVVLREPGMVAMHTSGDVVVLSSGQQHNKMRGANEKYSKFAYSTRYGFNIEADDRNFAAASFDGMLGFSDDGVHFRMRDTLEEAMIADDRLYSCWWPWIDVAVETWLLPASPWHIRVHRITTPRTLKTTEGGFAIQKADFGADTAEQGDGRAVWHGRTDVSAIVDLSPAFERQGYAISSIANTNLIHAKTIIPQLRGDIGPGTTVLAAAVIAFPMKRGKPDALPPLPSCPSLEEIEMLFSISGQRLIVLDN